MRLPHEGIACEVIDPRSYSPLDTETILASVRKTGHLVVVDESHPRCSLATDIAALAAEEAFDALESTDSQDHRRPRPDSVQPAAGGRLPPQRRTGRRGRTCPGHEVAGSLTARDSTLNIDRLICVNITSCRLRLGGARRLLCEPNTAAHFVDVGNHRLDCRASVRTGT